VISKICFFSKAKLIWWHHHYPWYYNENTNFLVLLKRLLEKLSIKFIDTIIVNSNYLKDSLKKIYSVDAKILYPIVDIEFTKVKLVKKDFTKKTIFTYSRRVK
jgi:hypothetical protein